jgi:methylglutaconyl-CoA hydratase
MTNLLVDSQGRSATLTLNRPEKRNALDDALVSSLTRALRGFERNDDVHVVLLRAAGPDFCAGADLVQTDRHARELDTVGNLADATLLGTLFITMRRLQVPIVAAVQGRALAGGAGLAMGCDLVLMHQQAEMGYPEVLKGLVPAMVGAILRRNVGEKIAFELLACGGRISAAECLRLGLVNRVFAESEFEAATGQFVNAMAASPRATLMLIKRLLYGVDGASFEDAIGRGAEINILARLSSARKQ